MFGQYAAFIIPSYLVTFFLIAGLVGWILFTHKRRKNEISRLEKQSASKKAKKDAAA